MNTCRQFLRELFNDVRTCLAYDRVRTRYVRYGVHRSADPLASPVFVDVH